ncbi:unnamed protein product [Caenorhabditis nigoni]
MIPGSILDINSESEASMFGHQWKIRGFAERVMIVSWIRVLDHWHLVNDDQSEDKGRQIVANWIFIINALESHGVEPSYVRVLENIYHDAESNIKILDDLTPVTIKRGVRQGCVLSPLLFNAVLEQVFNSLQWDEKHEYSIGINGDRLTNLRYADDIALIAHDRDTMQKMVDELIQESKKVGLVINKKKNVAMTNLPTTSPDNLNIKINGQNINIVDKFIYLGSSVSFEPNNNEIQRRISSAWGAFTKHRQFLTDRRAAPRLKKRKWEDKFKERLQEVGTPGVLWMRMARESKKDWDTLMTPARNRRQ